MDTHPRLAVMQPYVFPYIGYFHLISSSSLFIFCDDVNYIKQGWINRNRILSGNDSCLFVVPMKNRSQNRLINEICPLITKEWKAQFYNQLRHNYRKAPYFSDVVDPIMGVFESEYTDVTDLAINSIVSVYSYLGMDIAFDKSSVCAPETRGLGRSDRLIEMSKRLGFSDYVNLPGGREIYSKEYFKSNGIDLHFIRSHPIEYNQHTDEFVPFLSIIDILMFNSKADIVKFFSEYSLD